MTPFLVRAKRATADRNNDLGRPSDADRLAMLKWHLDRYDRLRSSTVTRASVVLSAGAILSAGNALLIGQVLGSASPWITQWGWRLAITVAILASSVLVVSSLIKAAGVLLTRRASRELFPVLRDIPVGPIFNGSDTVEKIKTFAAFRVATRVGFGEMADAAEVDLWVCIHQHRYRYARLRTAVGLLRYAALAFLAILISVLAANLAYTM